MRTSRLLVGSFLCSSLLACSHSTGGSGGASGAAGSSVAGMAGASAAGASGSSGTAGTAGAAGTAAGSAGSAGLTGGSAGTAGSSGVGGSSGSGGSGGQAPVTCLPSSQYAAVLTLSPMLPLCVTGYYTTTVPLASSQVTRSLSWGAHGGPLQVTAGTSSPFVVHRWALPSAPTGAATDTPLTPPSIPSLPMGSLTWGASIDTQSGTLISYTTSGAQAAGEVLYFSEDLSMLKSRASVNGYASGVTDTVSGGGTTERLLYMGQSTVPAPSSGTNQAGLYFIDACMTGMTCTPGAFVFSWSMIPELIIADDAGNVFAGMSDGTGTLYNSFAYQVAFKPTLSSGNISARAIYSEPHGTPVGAAAIAPTGMTRPGWFFAVDSSGGSPQPAVAVSYLAYPTIIASQMSVQGALSPANAGASYTVFGDRKGHVWVAVDTSSGAALLELTPM